MKNKNAVNPLVNELSEEMQKAIALMQFNNESYLLCECEDGEVKAYIGDNDEVKTEYNDNYSENQEINTPISFEQYCAENLDEVEPIDGDEERDNYIVLTDSEADKKCKDYILDSLWAFNPEFLANQTDLDPEVFQAIQNNGRCESNNDSIERLINKLGNMDDFVTAAISADGRGHFMSSYDGHENEETVGGMTYYIYRMN